MIAFPIDVHWGHKLRSNEELEGQSIRKGGDTLLAKGAKHGINRYPDNSGRGLRKDAGPVGPLLLAAFDGQQAGPPLGACHNLTGSPRPQDPQCGYRSLHAKS